MSNSGLHPARLLCPWNSPARILEQVAASYSWGSSQPRDQTHVSCNSCIGRRIPGSPWEDYSRISLFHTASLPDPPKLINRELLCHLVSGQWVPGALWVTTLAARP